MPFECAASLNRLESYTILNPQPMRAARTAWSASSRRRKAGGSKIHGSVKPRRELPSSPARSFVLLAFSNPYSPACSLAWSVIIKSACFCGGMLQHRLGLLLPPSLPPSPPKSHILFSPFHSLVCDRLLKTHRGHRTASRRGVRPSLFRVIGLM